MMGKLEKPASELPPAPQLVAVRQRNWSESLAKVRSREYEINGFFPFEWLAISCISIQKQYDRN
jgi:hypothetical protein